MSEQIDTQIYTPEETPVYPFLPTGELFENRFGIEKQIADTFCSRVYIAQDNANKFNRVALKVQKPRNEALTIRAKREIQIAKRFKHAHLITLIDSGLHDFEEGRAPYLVTELVEEGDLSKKKVTSEEDAILAIGALSQAAEALRHLHQNGIVHRDFKPQNILFDGKYAWLTDLGTAKAYNDPDPEGDSQVDTTKTIVASGGQATLPKEVIGTPSYMSIQRSTNEPASPSDDVFAWGVSAYEELVGELPWGKVAGPTPNKPSRRTIPYIIRGAPGRHTFPDFVSKEIVEITMACIEKERENRPSVDEIIAIGQATQ